MKKILITAGPTREAIDPVRFISNHSSGKMGYALAEAALGMGFETVLVSGPVALRPPPGLAEFVSVTTTEEMARAVKQRFPRMDAAVLCAAVADYRPVQVSDTKIKKGAGRLILELERTEDILQSLGTMKQDRQTLVGFAAETDHLETNALDKLRRKNLDWIAANLVGLPGRGFQADINAVTLFSADGRTVDIPLCSKHDLAQKILQTIFPEEAKASSKQ